MSSPRNGAGGIGNTTGRLGDRTGIAHPLLAGLCLAALLPAPVSAEPRHVLSPIVAPAGEQVPLDRKSLEDRIAELPRPEDLVPGQSLAAFMQDWIPHHIRNAALRRMWRIDPAIRDFENPARVYALDYNTPGAAPGYGPVEASAAMFWEAMASRRERTIDADRIEPITASTHSLWGRLWAWWR